MLDMKFYEQLLNMDGVTSEAKRLASYVAGLVTKSCYMRGYPKWKKKQDMIKNNWYPVPGLGLTPTWCPYPVYYTLKNFNYRADLITDFKYADSIAIHYTTANEMVDNIKHWVSKGVIWEVEFAQALNAVNTKGIPIVVASNGIEYNSKRKTGHIAILAPNPEYSHTDAIYVMQAGHINGFIPLDIGFPNDMVEEPTCYILPLESDDSYADDNKQMGDINDR